VSGSGDSVDGGVSGDGSSGEGEALAAPLPTATPGATPESHESGHGSDDLTGE
jgi:hypothetical protein